MPVNRWRLLTVSLNARVKVALCVPWSCSRSRCGDGVSVVNEMTVLHRVELIWPRTQASCLHGSSVAVKFISYRGIEGENAHFQPSAWGFLTTKHSRRFADDVALALREKILAGIDFRVANRLWADNGRNLSVQCLRLEHWKHGLPETVK